MVSVDNYIGLFMCVCTKMNPFYDFWEGVYVCYVGIYVSCPLDGEGGAK